MCMCLVVGRPGRQPPPPPTLPRAVNIVFFSTGVFQVLEGMFGLAGRLFGVSITPADGEAEVWNPDVRFFNIKDTASGGERREKLMLTLMLKLRLTLTLQLRLRLQLNSTTEKPAREGT